MIINPDSLNGKFIRIDNPEPSEAARSILYVKQAGFFTSDSCPPYREKKEDLEIAFDEFIRCSHTEIVHTSEKVAKKAAKIRAEYHSFKAMDAFQLAVAEMSKCTLFITNDKQLRQYNGIRCILIDDLAFQVSKEELSDPFYSEENTKRLEESIKQIEQTGGTIHEVD